MTNQLGIKKNISYLTISDIHFLNDQNDSQHIYESFMQYMDGFSSKSRFKDLDIIFIAGDIFDTYKDTKHPDNLIVSIWMQLMMAFCKRHGIKLRILEGTPGHDYKQAANYQPLADATGEGLDYKYVGMLSFERMEDLGLTILYVPDEWGGSAAECKRQIIEMMERNNIDKFDIACMHGMCDFQIPEVGDHPLKHDSGWLMEIVRSFINIGHDHTFKVFGRIIIQGSFDRMAHGEEGKKGAVVCHLRMDGEHIFEFIENKNARIFKTIKVTTSNLEKGISQVRAACEKVPNHSHIRISSSKHNPILSVIDEFKLAFPTLKFKKHHDDKQDVQGNGNILRDTVSLKADYVPIALNRDNIIFQIFENIEGQLDPLDRDLLTAELEALV